jgi:DNA invertase Pin-like site-specific DNA recombinase
MAEVKEKFLELIKNAKPKQRKKRLEPLAQLLEEVREARKLGFSFKDISDFMVAAGLKNTPHQVRRFCQEVLNEKPRNKRKKTKKTTEVAKTIPPKAAAPVEAAPAVPGIRRGFRIAKDDL